MMCCRADTWGSGVKLPVSCFLTLPCLLRTWDVCIPPLGSDFGLAQREALPE